MINAVDRLLATELAVVDALRTIGRTIISIRFDKNNHAILEYKMKDESKSKYLDITDLTKEK
jgi:hypothetical protein